MNKRAAGRAAFLYGRDEGFMKTFGKDTKKITVNGCLFHCVINQFLRNEDVGFRVYSSKM